MKTKIPKGLNRQLARFPTKCLRKALLRSRLATKNLTLKQISAGILQPLSSLY